MKIESFAKHPTVRACRRVDLSKRQNSAPHLRHTRNGSIVIFIPWCLIPKDLDIRRSKYYITTCCNVLAGSERAYYYLIVVVTAAAAVKGKENLKLSLIHISEPTRPY